MDQENKILVLGPYFGSFEYEITTFRPHMMWIHNVLESKSIYLYTHFNRIFMYEDMIDRNRILPVYKQLSRDETGQNGYMHNSLTAKDYNLFVRNIKDHISNIERCTKRDINVYNLNYTKSITHYPIHKKIFSKISIENIDIPDELKNRKIFIPHKNQKESEKIYKYIRSIDEEFIVIGSITSPLKDYNILLKNIDYFENVWRYIISMITYSNRVICPISFWTFLCNLQKVKVFSWGEGSGQYGNGGIYNFDNLRASIIPNVDIDSPLRVFINS